MEQLTRLQQVSVASLERRTHLQAVTNPKSSQKHGRSLLGLTYGKSVTNPNLGYLYGMVALGPCRINDWKSVTNPKVG